MPICQSFTKHIHRRTTLLLLRLVRWHNFCLAYSSRTDNNWFISSCYERWMVGYWYWRGIFNFVEDWVSDCALTQVDSSQIRPFPGPEILTAQSIESSLCGGSNGVPLHPSCGFTALAFVISRTRIRAIMSPGHMAPRTHQLSRVTYCSVINLSPIWPPYSKHYTNQVVWLCMFTACIFFNIRLKTMQAASICRFHSLRSQHREMGSR